MALITSASFSLLAQEGTQHANDEAQELNNHPELNLNEDKTLLIEDSKQSKSQVQSHEPVSTSAHAKKPAVNEKKKEDPFSFNFLYFMIEKFKFSDIVDEDHN